MRLTVIVPAYKAEQYIEESIESILNQTACEWFNVDVVVICDGDESCFDICSQYSADIGLVLLSENVGTYKAINTGIRLASERSTLIGTMGADDRVKPRCYERIISMAEKGDTVAAYSVLYSEIDKRGRTFNLVNRHAPTGQFFYTKKVFDALGGFRDWRCGADTEFWHRAKVIGCKLQTWREHLFEYRRHPDQITANKKYGFGAAYRQSRLDHINRIQYDHSLAGYVEPICGEIEKATGKLSALQLAAIANPSL